MAHFEPETVGEQWASLSFELQSKQQRVIRSRVCPSVCELELFYKTNFTT
jgi:hypothetical protein